MKVLLVISVVFASGCDRHVELTRENKTVRRYVDQSVCTKQEMLLYQWESEFVNHFDQNEYVLHRANKDDLEKYSGGTFRAVYDGSLRNVSLVPRGAVLKVTEIFYYHTQLCCKGYYIMATLNGNKIDGKLIKISTLFDRPPTGPENPPEEGLDIGEARLIDEYAALCSESES